MSQNKVFSCLKSSFLGAKVSLVKWATDNREDNDAWPWGFLSLSIILTLRWFVDDIKQTLFLA
jgi:hypothetical protein